MKVKLIYERPNTDLQKQINMFIRGVKVIDIKFQVCASDYGIIRTAVMIMYEEKEK